MQYTELFNASSAKCKYKVLRHYFALERIWGIRIKGPRVQPHEYICMAKKKSKVWDGCSHSQNILKIPLSRDEPMSQPEKMQLLTQITEFAFLEDKILHTAITNCFDGMIVDWVLGYHASSDLINTMLDAVNANTSNGCHSPVRSDRGCHYGWRK